MELSLEHIAEIVGASISANLPLTVSHVAFDSRSLLVNPGETAFFAIQTGSNDGHRFVEEMYRRGVRVFVVEKEVNLPQDAAIVRVSSSLKALQTLAAAVRADFAGKVVAVTGTRGKTVVKEWLNALLANTFRVWRSPRSFNSQIGVPLSLTGLAPTDEVAIIEAGISLPGEMAVLEKIIRPDITIFTGVDGREHADGFADSAEQTTEKLTLAKRAAALVYDLDACGKQEHKHAVSISQHSPEADLTLEGADFGEDCTTLRLRWQGGEPFELTARIAMQPFEVADAMLAVAAALTLGADIQTISKEFKHITHVKSRMRVIDAIHGATLVYDSFTPDLSGIQTALDFARRRTEPERHISVILGELVGDIWEQTGALLTTYRIARVIVSSEAKASLLKAGITDIRTEVHIGAPEEAIVEEGATILAVGRGLERVVEQFEARRHQTVMRVNLDALMRNFRTLRAHMPQGTKMVCMVKAFGYGTGSYQLARTLQDAGTDYLAVAAVDEGMDLRRGHIATPIIVLNPRLDDYAPLFGANLEPAVYSLPLLRHIVDCAVAASCEGYPIHLKLDTGMHRVGFLPEELDEVCCLLCEPAARRAVRVATVFSHLATADDAAEDEYTLGQLSLFADCCRTLRELLPEPSRGFLRHILNSAGMLRFPEYAFEMVRPGIALYGYNPVQDICPMPLEPVATLSSVIIALRKWPAGTTIGYNRRGRLTRDSVIATVPIGYADGISRRLGYGNLMVEVAGIQCPTVGTICMDLMMVDVTEAVARGTVQVGDRVVIFGASEHGNAATVASTLQTISYEVLTSVSARVKRIYYRE